MQLNKKIFIGIGIVVVLTVCAISTLFMTNLNKADVIAMNYDFTIVAEIDDNSGVDVNSGFLITSAEDYSLDTVEDIIKIEPQIDYDITKKGSGSYYLKPKLLLIIIRFIIFMR